MPPAQPTADADTAPAPGQHTALYRRFRAQRFSELIGQDPIVATLRNAVTGDRLAHAYLFVGPRGTGKTSTARILAKAINCTNLGADGEPCDTCPACVSIREGRALDVIEIDAASHGAVEDARDLVMRALTSPSELRKRVYIIDEVHMLSSHAFNALLKLIEEPPDHVVFILATTDTHKVPATIISRTQRHDFRRLPEATIVGKLRRIVEAEGVEADDDALALIARLADGGMRDAESLLDQVIAYADARLTEADVREAVGLADDAAIGALVDAYLAGDAPAALDARRVPGGRGSRPGAGRRPGRGRGPPSPARLRGRSRGRAPARRDPAHPGRGRRRRRPRGPLTPDARAPRGRAAAGGADRVPGDQTCPRARSPDSGRPARPPPRSRAPSPEPAARTRAAARSLPRPRGGGGRGTGLRRRHRPASTRSAAGWATVVDRASPVIKPLLKECRPIARDGARLTLAFPEGRDFMRSRISQRAPQIEALLTDMFGGPFAIECVASNLELEPLTVEQAVGEDSDDPEARALLEGVLKITGGELVDAPEVR